MLALLASISSKVMAETGEHKTISKGPYLGQKTPGLIPEVFAPGIISTPGWEYGVVFSPSMNEMYYLKEVGTNEDAKAQLVVFEKQEENWVKRVDSPRVGTPTLSTDNNTMFLGRGYKQRTQKGWSEIKRLGPDFEPFRIMRVTSSFNGTLAFDEAVKDGEGLLRYSTLKNGKYLAPKPFPKQINTGKWNAHPFIAPDESYVIWDGQRGIGMQHPDLFISFKERDGTWGEAIKFGEEINTPSSEFAAQVSPDGKYLFFNRNVAGREVDTFWVDAKVIEQLKPEHLKKYAAKQAPKGTPTQAVSSLRDIPALPRAFIDTAPTSNDTLLNAGKLALAKDKTTAIVQLAKEIGEGKYGKYDSLMIAHNNTLVFESYHQKGRYNLAHPQASATKGLTSLIVGRAIQLGYLTMDDLNKPLISFLKDLDKSTLAKGADKITLHKALTMQGGLTIDREKWQEIEKTPASLQGQGLVQTLLEQSLAISNDSQHYKYGNFNPMLVMTVIDAVVPTTAEDFIKTELLDKLNISNYRWQTHISGLPQAGSRASLTSRDMLKLGFIVANNGKWQGQPFISADYLAKATTGIVKPTEDWMPKDYQYGYFWYHTPVNINDKSYDVSFAWGGGGQRIIVVKALNLVIAITGHDRDDTIMNKISEVVIPAFI